jgi:hypothetical protein
MCECDLVELRAELVVCRQRADGGLFLAASAAQGLADLLPAIRRVAEWAGMVAEIESLLPDVPSAGAASAEAPAEALGGALEALRVYVESVAGIAVAAGSQVRQLTTAVDDLRSDVEELRGVVTGG